MSNYIHRVDALVNICAFCDSKCAAEKNKGKSGYGLRCAVWYAINSMEGINVGQCYNCARASDNRQSGTECPIEKHYALPKNGYCHLWREIK